MKKCYKMLTLTLIRCLLLQVFYFNFVSSHGRLFQPPGRSSAWRYGFSTPINYNDHELYCGGYSTQWGINGGKCGLCGDAYSAPKPRPNENGGTFGRGVIVQKYKRGQEIELGVELSAFHMGYFEFRLCPHNAPNLPEDENCFDKYLLLKADGGGSRFYPGPGSKYKINYLLPKELTCKQCVLQWRYVAGNNWGRCSNGTGMVGCGPQEEFRSCSDVQITEDDGSADETPGIVPAIASIPEDSEDYNDIKSNLQSQNVEQTQSNTGQIVALVMSFLVALLFLLGILLYYFCKKGTMKQILKKGTRPTWPAFLIPSLKISSLKKTNPSATNNHIHKISSSDSSLPENIPPVPPRRNRPPRIGSPTDHSPIKLVTDIQARKPILTISFPTRVSINGVQVTPSKPSSHAELHVPSQNKNTIA